MNKVFHGDCLDILPTLEAGSVDLCYMDPPFNTGRIFDDFGDTHESLESYIAWLERVVRSVGTCLKPKGSIYLHCDDNAVHYIKVMMDRVFGRNRFKADIRWKRSAAHNQSKRFGRELDSILFYGENINTDAVRVPYAEDYVKMEYRYSDERGRYGRSDMVLSPNRGNGYQYEFLGYTRKWAYPKDRMMELLEHGLIHVPKKGGLPKKKIYLKESKGRVPGNLWVDIKAIGSTAKERVGYSTQKPLALLERIIKASSNDGDVVLDPFCGSGTTLVAAKKLGRSFIGIDSGSRAVSIASERLGLK